MRPVWMRVRDIEEAQREATQEVLERLYLEAYQRGVERGRLRLECDTPKREEDPEC